MYGNRVIPGITAYDSFRYDGSIWRGYPEATWFKVVPVEGAAAEAKDIPVGSVMKITDNGSYEFFTKADIITNANELPGVRIGIVADYSAKTGVTVEEDDGHGGKDNVKYPHGVLIGIMGEVNQDKILVEDTPLTALEEEEQAALRTQLESWNLHPVYVSQA